MNQVSLILCLNMTVSLENSRCVTAASHWCLSDLRLQNVANDWCYYY